MSKVNYASKRVLIVDELGEHLYFVKRAMESIGFKDIDLTRTSNAAIRQCKKFKYDIILCDYNMGDGKNGQQILEELKFYQYINHSCVFIMITAETSSKIVLGAIEQAPDGYIIKPFNELVLRKKIETLLAQEAILSKINKALDDKKYPEAIKQCNEVIEKNPRFQSFCLQTIADVHFKMGDYDAAIKLYQSVMEGRPPVWARLGMGKTLYAMNKFDKAIKELELLLNSNKYCVQAYDLLGQCYKHIGNTQEAQSILEAGVKLSPFSINRQRMLGDISVANKDFDTATTAYRCTTRIGQHSVFDSSKNYISLARSITDGMAGNSSREDSRKVVEVIRIFKKLSEKFGDEIEVEIQKEIVHTRLLVKQQKSSAATQHIEHVEQVIEEAQLPMDLNVKVDLARTYMALGDEAKFEKCIMELEKETEVDVDIQLLVRSIVADSLIEDRTRKVNNLNDEGATFYENNEIEKAIERFLDAVKLTPKSLAVNLNLIQAILKALENGEKQEEYTVICRESFSNIDEMTEETRNYARYTSLRKRFDIIENKIKK